MEEARSRKIFLDLKCPRCDRARDATYVGEDGEMVYGDWFSTNCGIYFYQEQIKPEIMPTTHEQTPNW
ncbi:MAG: hypothetical protein RM022_012955 [Nostoc sp. EfeVER01]|uniref:hypothetical protein n=1 Tax=unclassified Nostoc TaxID=2593658 RepID=UPI002AD4D159|nr:MULTISPECIES: hypothetical protein [unclassified Nostoc]MDZ7947484.1 hypothetical protein [Nostoc sp. EfeVER01]MDZ7996050.1 hypothetical protein [Nostoc sp. EspVER01]